MDWVDGLIKRIIIITIIIFIGLWIRDKFRKLDQRIHYWFLRKIQAERERNFPLTDAQLREEYVLKAFDELDVDHDYDESFELYKYIRIHSSYRNRERK